MKKEANIALLAEANSAKSLTKKTPKEKVSNSAKRSALAKRVDSFRVDPKDVIIDSVFLQNPRTEFYESVEVWDAFKESIAEKGVLDPIKLAMMDGKFYLSHGERRMRAVNEINAVEPGKITSIPFVQVPVNAVDTLVGHFIYNSGKQLTDVERGNGLLALRNLHGLTMTGIAKKTFIPYQKVVTLVNLVEKADHEILTALQKKELSTDVAKKIVNTATTAFEQREMLNEGREAAAKEAAEKAAKKPKATRKPKAENTVKGAVEIASTAVAALTPELGSDEAENDDQDDAAATATAAATSVIKIKGKHIAEVAATTLPFDLRFRILLTRAKNLGTQVDQKLIERVEAIFDFVRDVESMDTDNLIALFETINEEA